MRATFSLGASALATFSLGASALAALSSLSSIPTVSAQQSGPAGNAVAYDFTPFAGKLNFQSVKALSASGACNMQPSSYSGPIAPLNQELTAVFRGPMRLNAFAVYQPAGASSSAGKKRAARSSPMERRHAHNHHARFHERDIGARDEGEPLERRGCGDMVTAVINGVSSTFPDTWNCPAGAAPAAAAPAAASPAPASPPAVAAPPVVNQNNAAKPSSSAAASSAAPAPAAPSAAPSSGSSGGAWTQVATYNSSTPSSTKGLTFLYNIPYSYQGYLPGSGSTTSGPAANPQVLQDVKIEDNSAFSIASATPASGDGVASAARGYHGFSGSKIFLSEFSMPLSGLRNSGSYPDMPAYWFLNSQITNTQQFGACSCWATGCGEMDVHEVLSAGGSVGYSTLHMGQHYCGGASNGFARPSQAGKTQKLAVILNEGSNAASSVVRIVVLPDSYQFGSGISKADYDSWTSMSVTGGQKGSLQTGAACPSFTK